jgi:hypothetical protein
VSTREGLGRVTRLVVACCSYRCVVRTVLFVLHALAFALTTRLTTGQTYKHNQHYLRLIKAHRPAFREAQSSAEQEQVIRDVLSAIGDLSPPGRFLKQQEAGGGGGSSYNKNKSGNSKENKKEKKVLWYPVEDVCAIDKIRQALRDKAKKPPQEGTLEVIRACDGVDLTSRIFLLSSCLTFCCCCCCSVTPLRMEGQAAARSDRRFRPQGGAFGSEVARWLSLAMLCSTSRSHT